MAGSPGARALVIGGSGSIGSAVVRSLLGDGWEVEVVSRGRRRGHDGVVAHEVDRADDAAFGDVLARGYEVVVDIVGFGPDHARQLASRAADIGSIVAVSSAGLYVDGAGRAMESISDVESSPVFAAPVVEGARTVDAEGAGYASRKRAYELALLEGDAPATVLRPATVHGPGSTQPREWFYARRILDGRSRFVLGFGGRGAWHPVSVANLAEMTRLAASRPGRRVLNAGDPGRPDEAAIARGIAAAMGADVEIVLVDGEPPCASPWSLAHPVLLSLEAARSEIGYEPVLTYEEAVAVTVEALLAEHARGELEPRLAASNFGGGVPGFPVRTFLGRSRDPFDYAAEDDVLAAR